MWLKVIVCLECSNLGSQGWVGGRHRSVARKRETGSWMGKGDRKDRGSAIGNEGHACATTRVPRGQKSHSTRKSTRPRLQPNCPGQNSLEPNKVSDQPPQPLRPLRQPAFNSLPSCKLPQARHHGGQLLNSSSALTNSYAIGMPILALSLFCVDKAR